MTPAELLAIRRELRLSQTEMANKLRISQARYGMYETGKRVIPEHIALLVELVTKTDSATD